MIKVVLITGASSGIGAATAKLLMKNGFMVYGTTRNSNSDNFLGKNLLTMDVTLPDTIETAVNNVLEKEGRIDILINNAGKGIAGPIEDTSIKAIEGAFNTNLYGPVRVCKEVLPIMRKQKSGLIINVTSIAGYMGLPYRGVYSASKGALALLTEALNMEVQEFGVRAITVAPGDVATNIAAGRYYTPVYENSAYKKMYKVNLDLMDAHVDSGMPPKKMAAEILKIIKSNKGKTHYKVGGKLEKLSIVLKRLLPDRMYEKMLMKHYKMR